MLTRLSNARIALSIIALGFIAADAQAGALTLVGQVTSCAPTSGEQCVYPFGTPTLTRVVFDHQRVRPVGVQWIPIGRVHGSIDVWVGDRHWDETQDFEYWNEETPWSPEDGWYSPELIFRDGLLAGLSFYCPSDYEDLIEIRGFRFDTGDGASGLLTLEAPGFLPGPGAGLLFAGGLLAMVHVRRRNLRVNPDR